MDLDVFKINSPDGIFKIERNLDLILVNSEKLTNWRIKTDILFPLVQLKNDGEEVKNSTDKWAGIVFRLNGHALGQTELEGLALLMNHRKDM